MVGISTKQTQRDSKYTGSETELNSVLISDENNSTQSDTSNEKLEKVNKPRSDKKELKVEVSKKKVLTKYLIHILFILLKNENKLYMLIYVR